MVFTEKSHRSVSSEYIVESLLMIIESSLRIASAVSSSISFFVSVVLKKSIDAAPDFEGVKEETFAKPSLLS